MQEEIVRCECSDVSHLVQFTYFNENDDLPPQIYIQTILDNRHNFFKRIWYAFRYIFLGDISKYGMSQECVLGKEEVRKIHYICSTFLRECDDNNSGNNSSGI